MPTVTEWVAAIEAYVDTPFRHMGKNKHGMDCLGLLVCAGEDIGITDKRLHEIKGYRSTPTGSAINNNIGKFLVNRRYNRLQALRDQVKLGDIIVFRIEDAASPRHMGVYLGVGSDNMDYMVHADGVILKVTKTIVCPTKWVQRVQSVWYLNELNGGDQ